jgi:GH43 family beta-xylosidase
MTVTDQNMKSYRLGGAGMVLLLMSSLASLSTGPALGQSVTSANPEGPMGITGADPSIVRTEGGFVSVESVAGRTLYVREAPSLAELAKSRPIPIWRDRDGLGEVWAPEIVRHNGRFEVYFAAGAGSAHRMHVIKSDSPASGYGVAAEVVLPQDKWAIDGVPFTYQNKRYFVWSGWQGDVDLAQDIFIAAMDADGQVLAPRVLISSPDQTWENIGEQTPAINEAPQPVLDPAGQLHIVYSANGSWGENYCLADLRLKAGAEPLDAAAWLASDGCLFGANAATLAAGGTLAREAKGVGHHSFVLPDEDHLLAGTAETALPFVYHGVPAEEQPRNFWAARKWFIGAFQWVPDVTYGGDSPDLGWGLAFSE